MSNNPNNMSYYLGVCLYWKTVRKTHRADRHRSEIEPGLSNGKQECPPPTRQMFPYLWSVRIVYHAFNSCCGDY
jgi:hypothetical protein